MCFMKHVECIRNSLGSDLRIGKYEMVEKRRKGNEQREKLNCNSTSTKESSEFKGRQPVRVMLHCGQEMGNLKLIFAYC